MKSLALLTIRFYQRFVSPYKGFRCAYRAHTGCASCSALGFRAIRRYGVWRGAAVTRRRFGKCGVAYRRYAQPPRIIPRKQAGFFHLACDALPCAFNFEILPCEILNPIANACCCGDWPSSRKDSKEEEKVHIPPRGPQVDSNSP